MNKNKLYPWQLQRVADALDSLANTDEAVTVKIEDATLYFYIERDGKLESLVGVCLEENNA